MQTAEQRLLSYLQDAPYLNYVYSYPHKTSYRVLEKPLSLKQLWQEEDKSSLFLYLHIPFCEMRCGYCNLFTLSKPQDQLVNEYLAQLILQMQKTAEYLGDFHFEQLAIGGGTPTYLSTSQLTTVFEGLERYLGAKQLPASVEVSPNTVDSEKLAVLKDFGVERVSIGIESFQANDLKNLGRPQSLDKVASTLKLIRDSGITRLNIDLIYGNPEQTEQSWLASLQQALEWQPEELFIYPLYVRPLTGLDKKQKTPDNKRLRFYELARDYLFEQGYQQSSMRMFYKSTSPSKGKYRCQEDGMIGLGAGARSYTQSWHYSSNYAVAKTKVAGIIEHYNNADSSTFETINYGIELDQEDQKRRYILLSLFQVEGLNFNDYQTKFNSTPLVDFPELELLVNQQLAHYNSEYFALTAQGIAYSDLIGNWFFSERIRQRMADWQWQ